MGTTFTTQWQRFVGDERGAVTAEFVVLFMPLCYMLFMIAELSVYMTRQALLERGLNMAVRDLRLGALEVPGLAEGAEPTEAQSAAAFRARICEGAFLLTECNDRLRIEVTPFETFTEFGESGFICPNTFDPDLSPMDLYTPVSRQQLTLVKACLVSSPIFPGVGLGAQMDWIEGSGYANVSRTAFISEP
ncbi:MAG: hypothetical protein AAGI34_16965 [Pseudomonadota bacterium]